MNGDPRWPGAAPAGGGRGDRPALPVRGGDRCRGAGAHRSLEQGTEHFAEALDYFPAIGQFAGAADRYLASLEHVKARAAVPVIASLNATSRVAGSATPAGSGAGADALELNLYRVAADPSRTAADMEAADLELIAAVRAAVTIPLAVKLSPYYSALADFAAAAVGPAPTASSSSIASTSPTSTSRPSTWSPGSS